MRVGALPKHVHDAGRPSGRRATLEDADPQVHGIVTDVSDLNELRDRMRTFAAERDWEQFHDPKSLVLALVGEVGELGELFQWLPADKAKALAAEEPLHTRAAEELSDVLLYLIRLADILDIDLRQAADAKMNASERRFPTSEVHGVAPPKT